MIIRNNQAYNRYFDAINRTSDLIEQRRSGICITVALTALLGRQRIKEFQPEHLSQERYREFLFFQLLQRGIHLTAPQNLSDFYDGIRSLDSRGALFMVPGHAFALIKLYDKDLLSKYNTLSLGYKRLDTANRRGIVENIDAVKLLEMYESADKLREVEYNPILFMYDTPIRE